MLGSVLYQLLCSSRPCWIQEEKPFPVNVFLMDDVFVYDTDLQGNKAVISDSRTRQ